MTKHHLVQSEPVASKAAFWGRDSFSAGRRKSAAPARTTPHFITGALFDGQYSFRCGMIRARWRCGRHSSKDVCVGWGLVMTQYCIPEMYSLDSNFARPHSLCEGLCFCRSGCGSLVSAKGIA